MSGPVLETERLILRRWRAEDQEPFAALNADPEVTEHLGSPLSRDQSDQFIERIEAGFVARGFAPWALERKDGGEFIGFTGLWVPTFEAAFMPTVEVGWRLARGAWGNGFATEAAEAALREAFVVHRLPEVVAFTFEHNSRSRAVMARLGMAHDPSDDFEHPGLGEGHRLARHVLYRMPADRWRAQGGR